ncbi:unnamed protein product [Cylindrotheca closterium]|uniref:Transmembrane protein n=1 Tax=Cylindrotheca closterium TaxID=2856 RepID=A0AAD2G943_9STRA|nr:unnamed protein product [Cylindrotheca closterium]
MDLETAKRFFNEHTEMLAVATSSVIVGAFIWYQTSDTYEADWVQACKDPTNGNMEQWLQDHPGMVSYAEDFEFGAFSGMVCRQTQLYYQLNEYNASAIAMMLSATTSMPLLMAMLLEAGRGDAGGALKMPLIFWILSQEFGLAVVFPLLWLPLYCAYKGEPKSAINPLRVYASLPLVLPQLVLTILIFYLNPGSSGWSNCVGLLAGPIFSGCSMLLSLIGDPSTEETKEKKEIATTSRRLMALMYGAAGLLSVATWLWLLFFMIIPAFGWSSIQGVCDELWTNAPTKLSYKSLELLALWFSGLVYIGVQSGSPQAVIEAMSISAVFGPGAGLCSALAGVAVSEDMEAIEEAKRREQDKKGKKKGKKE